MNIKPEGCFTEYVIKVKDDSSSVTERHFTHGDLRLSYDNSDLANRVQDAYFKFLKGKPSESAESPEITVRAKMVWQR